MCIPDYGPEYEALVERLQTQRSMLEMATILSDAGLPTLEELDFANSND
jgi:hypothetical protein